MGTDCWAEFRDKLLCSHWEWGERAVYLLGYPKSMSSLNYHFLLTVMHNLPLVSTPKAAYLMESISMHI